MRYVEVRDFVLRLSRGRREAVNSNLGEFQNVAVCPVSMLPVQLKPASSLYMPAMAPSVHEGNVGWVMCEV